MFYFKLIFGVSDTYHYPELPVSKETVFAQPKLINTIVLSIKLVPVALSPGPFEKCDPKGL